MKNKIILSGLILSLSSILFNSCKKKTEVDNETQSVVDNAICEQQFMAIHPVINEKGINEAGIKRINACETFSVISGDTTDANGDKVYDNGPVTFQIDYGNTGCLSPDGVSLKTGKINITSSKRWSAYNNPVTINLVGYNIGTINYSGQITINRLDSVTLTVDVVNGHCSNGSWDIDYACSKTVKQIGGYSTKNTEADDIFALYGTSSGKNREGRNFTTSISSSNPLVKKSACKWISSGALDLTPEGFKTRTVDFGNGACDDDATFTVNGQTVSFKLK